jgi:hypothetical protein
MCLRNFAGFAVGGNQQRSKAFCPQAFDPNTNYGWPCNSGQCQQRVEIGIQGDDNPAFLTAEVENFRITRCG